MLIGPADPARAVFAASPYLDYAELERALRACRADAVWPGWGFVSEKAEFAGLCERLGITFIGPLVRRHAQAGRQDRVQAAGRAAGVPLAPWSGGPVADAAAARAQAESIGYPLMVKATAGGGGRGIRLVPSPEQLEEAFERASSEASKTAGTRRSSSSGRSAAATTSRCRSSPTPRAPSGRWASGTAAFNGATRSPTRSPPQPALDAEQEKLLRSHAAELTRAAGYVNAGTVEFLYEPRQQPLSVLEVNTRLQVEHPVTEATTGVNIVKLQLHIAAGGTLAEIGPAEPAAFGHAIEARLTAEDPEREFAPAPGLIEHLALPAAPASGSTPVGSGDVIRPVRLDDRKDDRLGPRPRRPRRLSARSGNQRGHPRRAREQGVPARPARQAGIRPRQGRYDLAGCDDGRRLRAAAEGRRCPAGHRLRGLRGARTAAARPAVHLRRARASRGRARDPAPGRCPRGRRGLPAPGGRTRPGRYQVELDGRSVEVDVERSGRFELRLGVGGQTFDVLSVAQGPDYLVEVDGAVHRILRRRGRASSAPRPRPWSSPSRSRPVTRWPRAT